MGLFRRRKRESVEDPTEVRFDAMISLVKDLPEEEYKKLVKAMGKAYDAYQTVRGLETEDDQITKAEITLEEEGKEK